MMPSRLALASALLAVPQLSANAQAAAQGRSGPSPTVANIHYAPATRPPSEGHKLDLYIPVGAPAPVPVVVWTAGSAWRRDDGKALRKCPTQGAPRAAGEMSCHDDAASPESQLIGCAIQTCPEKARAADPARYITPADPPLMILHGGSDPAVPHNQGERLYMALNKACGNAVFISVPKAGHGPIAAFVSDDAMREGATVRSTAAEGCAVTNPALVQPTWKTVSDFLDKYLK